MSDQPLASLFADLDAPVRRVVFARGVAVHRDDFGAWRLPDVPETRAAGTFFSALGGACPGQRPLDPPARDGGPTAPPSTADPNELAARHALRPLLVATGRGAGADAVHLVSAAGTLGWRPPVERLADDRALAPLAPRLRFAVDAIEYHATRAAEAYAEAAYAARRTAAVLGVRHLASLTNHPAPYLEIDALAAASARAFSGVASLVWAAFGPESGWERGARAARTRGGEREPAQARPPRGARFDAVVLRSRHAPAELRETLLDAWDATGAGIPGFRRVLHRHAGADLAPAAVRVLPLEPDVWGVSIALPAEPGTGRRGDGRGAAGRRRVDALDHAWTVATEALRAITLTIYAALADGEAEA